MIFVLYLLVASGVTFLSIKAADYVDWLDKKTSLSGAFIGGIMLSAVTSLPELFTSISSVFLLEEPGLCIGNILGSDLFNFMVLSVLMLITLKQLRKHKISNSHLIVLGCVFVSYIAIVLNMLDILDFEIMTVSITSIIIMLCYIVSFKYLANEDGEVDEHADNIPLTLKQIVVRFIIVSIGIIVLSICISYITDGISNQLNLGKGIAGALFMGIATSLPEVTSSITLFKKKNYDVAIGNIIGSNIFNLAILALTDFIYIKNGIYEFADPKTMVLLVSGAIATPLLFVAIQSKPKWVKMLTLVGVVLCYIAFLII